MKKIGLLFILIYSAQAFSFGGELHKKITKRALRPFDFSKEALTTIADANVWVDDNEPLNSASHVDSESFEAASSLMLDRLQLAADALIAGDIHQARIFFGNVTHTIQDFFSHSNYVEYMPEKPIDLLNLKNPSPEVTCSKHHKRNGLTTGYFPDETRPEGKCSHSMLNKDGGMIYVPHYLAAFYAKKHTAKMYRRFKEMVKGQLANDGLADVLLTTFQSGN